MSIKQTLPTSSDVRMTLAMLFGDELSVEEVAERPDVQYAGIYVDDDDLPVAAFACDLSFVAFAGSSLTMIPKGGAEDAIAEGNPSEMMLSNLQELINIGSNWFMGGSSPHLRFSTLHPINELPEDAKQLLDAEGLLALSTEIPNYGLGHIVCLVT